MTAARRDSSPPGGKPAIRERERDAILQRDFRHDLAHWIRTDPRIALHVMKLIEEIIRNPFSGVGKPEPLKHSLHGEWSRRITDRHRLEYVVSSPAIHFVRARTHYQR